MKHFFALCAVIMAAFSLKAVTPSGTLPVLYINTPNGEESNDKDKKFTAEWWIESSDPELAIGSAENPETMTFSGRGNYTWTGFDKKPYKLKLKKKTSLLGMAKNKNWGLLAHADGPYAFFRNLAGFEMSRLLGMPWTPDDEPVEFVLNGDYKGLYYLTETVKVASNRIDVFDYDSEKEDFEEANPGQTFSWVDAYRTGGYLVEIDNYDDPDQVQVETRDPSYSVLQITYDTPSDYITEEHKQYLIDQFSLMDKLIYEGGQDGMNWYDMIDLTDLARFFIAQGLTDNYESFHGSCKLWKEQEGLEKEGAFASDGKWHFGAVWDFGSALNRVNNSRIFFDNDNYGNHWVRKMFEYPAFKEELKRVYTEFIDAGKPDEFYAYIQAEGKRIEQAAVNDHERWPGYGNGEAMANTQRTLDFVRHQVELYKQLLGYKGADLPNAGFYLRGGHSGWECQEKYRFQLQADGTYIVKGVNFPADNEFKVGDSEWEEINYGGVKNIEFDKPYTLAYESNENCTMAQPISNAAFIFDPKTHTLTVKNEYIDDADRHDIYLRGDLNGWAATDEYKFAGPNAAGDYTLSGIDLPAGKNFKIADSQWADVNYGGPTDMVNNHTYTLVSGGANCTVAEEIKGATLTFNIRSAELTIGQPSGVSAIETADAPVRFFNLQGQEISAPQPGRICIKVQGTKAVKILGR